MKELPRMKNKLMMKKIGAILALLLGTGLLFSCSNSKDDDYMIDRIAYFFPENTLIQKLKANDSIVLHSKTPFNVEQVSFLGNISGYNVDYKDYQYQKVKFNWLTITHPTDTTLMLKVDSNFGSNIIQIQTDAVGRLKGCIRINSRITVIRDSIKR